MENMTSFVIDTNVILSDKDFYLKYEGMIIIPFIVLEEVDNFKTRMDNVGRNARSFIRLIDQHIADSVESGQDITQNIKLKEGGSYLRIKRFYPSEIPYSFSNDKPDNIIVGVALVEKRKGRETVVVSNDIQVRVKCHALGLRAIGHEVDELASKREDLFTGYKSVTVPDYVIDTFYNGEDLFIDEYDNRIFYANEFILLTSDITPKRKAFGRFINHDKPLRKVRMKFPELNEWSIKPRNIEQTFALDLLLDPDIKVVTLTGTAGTGKTLLAIASALAQSSAQTKKGKAGQGPQSLYKQVIISRPIQPMGKDIGFLPGVLEEKLSPWVQPIMDNIEFLFNFDKDYFNLFMSKGIVKVEAPTYIRGRSIPKAFIMFDEVQNLSKHEIKTILTRVGEDTKIVLTGDVQQIDNQKLNEYSNGLTYVIEKFKKYEVSGHISLKRGERSKVATIAAEVL